MNTSSRFAVAVHILCLLALARRPLPSSEIASSVNTNAALIRRLLGRLGAAGLTRSRRGSVGGTELARTPQSVTLREVYLAVDEGEVLALPRRGPNPDCPVGRVVTVLLEGVIQRAQSALAQALEAVTLDQLTQALEADTPPR